MSQYLEQLPTVLYTSPQPRYQNASGLQLPLPQQFRLILSIEESRPSPALTGIKRKLDTYISTNKKKPEENLAILVELYAKEKVT